MAETQVEYGIDLRLFQSDRHCDFSCNTGRNSFVQDTCPVAPDFGSTAYAETATIDLANRAVRTRRAGRAAMHDKMRDKRPDYAEH